MEGHAQTPIYIELSDSSGDDDGPHATAAVSNKRQRRPDHTVSGGDADGTAAHLDFREVKEEDQVIPRPAYLLGKQPVLGTSTFKGDKDELKGLGAAWGETVKGLPDTPQQVP